MIDPLDDLWFKVREHSPIIDADDPAEVDPTTLDRLDYTTHALVRIVHHADELATWATDDEVPAEWRERIADALHELSLHIWPDAAAPIAGEVA